MTQNCCCHKGFFQCIECLLVLWHPFKNLFFGLVWSSNCTLSFDPWLFFWFYWMVDLLTFANNGPPEQILEWASGSRRQVLKRNVPSLYLWGSDSPSTFLLSQVQLKSPQQIAHGPKVNTGVKKWHSFGLILRWNCLNLLNASLIGSNITSMLGAKIQMLSW